MHEGGNVKINGKEVDLDILYEKYEQYKRDIEQNPIDSDYKPLDFSQFADFYIRNLK